MAKDTTSKDVEEIKAEDETRDEVEEVREDAPEIDLPHDAPGAKTEAETTEEAYDDAEAKLAKAGKRSAKSVRDAEAETVRQELKEHRAEQEAEAEAEPKAPKRQLPNPLHQHGKKYRAAAERIEKGKLYSLEEALDLTKVTSTTKFDSSVELHVNLGVDPRQADQMVRASVVLPHGTGRKIRIAVYADGKVAEDAKAAGADIVGTDVLMTDIEKGKFDFDILIATPDKMAALGKVARILGPRGLMPNPKSGTVTPDPAKAVKEAKAGKVEFRIDKQAIVHQVIGKVSFSKEQLAANAQAFLSAILKSKPSTAKGTYVRGMAASSSMGPSAKIDAAATVSAISTSRK